MTLLWCCGIKHSLIKYIDTNSQQQLPTHTHTHTHTHTAYHIVHITGNNRSHTKIPRSLHIKERQPHKTHHTKGQNHVHSFKTNHSTGTEQKLTWLTAVKIKRKRSHYTSDRRRWRTANMLQWFLPVWLDNKPWKKRI